jgi:hypothetical protein
VGSAGRTGVEIFAKTGESEVAPAPKCGFAGAPTAVSRAPRIKAVILHDNQRKLAFEGSKMRLICYPTSGEEPKLVPAPAEREWMDRTDAGFAYRCLPLNIANAHGWLILNPAPFIARWTGGSGVDSVVVRPTASGTPLLASSHFGFGVLTFSVNALFRTEAGYDLLATGPFNQPKDGVQPLTGVVETDWAPFTFTMNWKFTRKNMPIAFARDEPFCMIFPVKRGLIEQVEPEFRALEADPELKELYTAWAEGRRIFNDDLKIPGSKAQAQKWQKDYFRGNTRLGVTPPDHRTRLRAREFADDLRR